MVCRIFTACVSIVCHHHFVSAFIAQRDVRGAGVVDVYKYLIQTIRVGGQFLRNRVTADVEGAVFLSLPRKAASSGDGVVQM